MIRAALPWMCAGLIGGLVARGFWLSSVVSWLFRGGPSWAEWVFTACGAAVGVGFVALTRARVSAHAQSVERACRRLGFRYTPSAEPLRREFAGLAEMPLFERWASGINRMSGKRNGRAVEIFDYTTAGDPTTHSAGSHLTVVVIPNVALPDFDLRPRDSSLRLLGWAGLEGVTFDPASAQSPDDAAIVKEFRKRFVLAAPDLRTSLGRSLLAKENDRAEDAVRRVFLPGVMQGLLCHPGWSAQSHGGYLALWRTEYGIGLGTFSMNPERTGLSLPLKRTTRFCPARSRKAYLAEALGVFRVLALSPDAAVLGTPLAARAPRLLAAPGSWALPATLGGVLGLAVGLLAAFGAAFSGAASSFVPHSAPLGFARHLFPAWLALTTVAGALVGSRLDPAFVRRLRRRQITRKGP